MGENFTLNLTSCQMQDSVMIEDNHPQSPAQFVEDPYPGIVLAPVQLSLVVEFYAKICPA